MLDRKDIQILSVIQENSKLAIKDIAKRVGLPITTTHSRLKRLERLGLIKGYKAILDAKKLGLGVTAFILVSFSYKSGIGEISQREVARRIATFPEVQEVHIITGDWDILLKVKMKNVDELGEFVVDKLRMIRGVDKTLTCVVLDTIKETNTIPLHKVTISKSRLFST